MNTEKPFKKFWGDLHSKFPEEFTRKFEESDIEEFGKVFASDCVLILQKDETMWETPKILFDVDLSDLWKRETSSHEIIWRHLQPCGIAYMMTKDFVPYFKESIPMLTPILRNFTSKKDEIDELLEDTENFSKLTEFFTFIKDLRIVSYLLNLIEKIDFSEIDLDSQDLEDVFKNFDRISQSPKFQKVQQEMKSKFEEKVRNGDISREVIASDVEKIKQKAIELFGDIFNDILGSRKQEVQAATILGNTPEARRARMIARLQRKLKDRK